jgi:hypothetical protein
MKKERKEIKNGRRKIGRRNDENKGGRRRKGR